MNKIKVILNPRVWSAIISAVGAIISAMFAGCALRTGEFKLKDFTVEIFSPYHTSTNNVQEVK